MLNVKMAILQFRPISGGAERQAEVLAKTLIQKQINVEVYTTRPRGVAAILPDDPVPVRRLFVPGYKWVRTMLLIPVFYRALLSCRHRVDILHIHQALDVAFAVVLAAQRMGIPAIVKCGNSGPRFDLDLMGMRNGIVGRWMAQYIARHATCFIALNDQIVYHLDQWKVESDRIIRIPNGVVIGEAVSSGERQATRGQLGLSREGFVVVGVGSLSPKKDFSTLLTALSKCNQSNSATLLLVGGGPEAPRLRAEAQGLGIASRVRFIGEIRPSDVRTYLAAADVFVLPSLTEGISNALLEAMAAGLPCVATNISGNRALIQHQATGLLSEVGDADSLAQSISVLQSNAELRSCFGQQARQRVASDFSIEHVADQYIGLYRKLTSVRSGR